MTSVLITGARGQLGTDLVAAAAAAGSASRRRRETGTDVIEKVAGMGLS